jgi:hypothetical protein
LSQMVGGREEKYREEGGIGRKEGEERKGR